ncbi:DUF92 domain-containing protein [Aspergillus saccharolyticus JOP 1030-1]|uniref:DUF92 domain protein n=1 Tax=Aspergillus saccharolyticus JOP 1030-1 TaxID=1450539 RepID=A0A318Z9D7_9EURO|nr:hypothetical protein BP01DRAFT_384051 [Aspergillus saccharolyticus JOP 1030-1]PYH43946.1 hypothetical protein BP01DRAFT_384051 [Aspergillus saccharolyticus JOP 1030-1]
MKAIIAVPAIAGLLYRAWSHKTLTPLGLVAAGLTASAHALHPWSTPFVLLAVFYLGGSRVTKVKHDIKSRLTLSATGSEGGEGPRTHVQVLANSIVASVLILAYTYVLAKKSATGGYNAAQCFSNGHDVADVLMIGIVANYAAVAADTFSSELGILSKSKPRLITSPTFRVVPPGTNGGVTGTGLLAGMLGAFTIALSSAAFLPFCTETPKSRAGWVVAVTVWGTLGSVLDSVLGGLFQASVVDKRTGKIVEGSGGKKVLIHPSSTKPGVPANTAGLTPAHGVSGGAQLRATEDIANTATLRGSKASKTPVGTSTQEHDEDHRESRRVESGHDILDNNAVNVLMALIMSVGAMGVASWAWGLDVRELAVW